MTYYYDKKDDAIAEGRDRFGEDWVVSAELEPMNGWVIVLTPKSTAYLTSPLEPILEYAEIRITHTIRRRPKNHKQIARFVPPVTIRSMPVIELKPGEQLARPWERASAPASSPPAAPKTPLILPAGAPRPWEAAPAPAPAPLPPSPPPIAAAPVVKKPWEV